MGFCYAGDIPELGTGSDAARRAPKCEIDGRRGVGGRAGWAARGPYIMRYGRHAPGVSILDPPCLELPLFGTLGIFADSSRAEVRAPPTYIASSQHPAPVVSERRPPAAHAMRVGLTSPFFFPHLFRTLWSMRCARTVVTPTTAPMSVPSPPRPNAPM